MPIVTYDYRVFLLEDLLIVNVCRNIRSVDI